MPRTRSPLVNLPGKWKFLKTQHGFRCAPMLTLIRLISWAVRCCVQTTVIVNLKRWNVKMRLPGSWRGLGKFLFVFRENYEPELADLEKHVSPGKTFIDVGANFGIYTVVASKLVGEAGRVIAFEPTAQSFDVLRKNVGLNNFNNVLTFRTAVSDEPGTGWLYYGTDPVQNSLGKNPCWDAGGEEVVMESLDHVLLQAGVDRVDVIKIDAEGAEELVLRGAVNLFSSMRPIVIYEVNREASAHLGLSEDGATKFLKRLGYEFFVHGRPGIASSDRPLAGYFNIVAIPKPLNVSSECNSEAELKDLVMSWKDR
jgi:FkbM family methyltransferase